MPEFQRKTQKFGGPQNWNRSIDTIPDGQIALGINVRANQQGETTSRPGLTTFSAIGATAYAHSVSRLNNYSGNLPFFDFVYVVGSDQKLYVGKTAADFANAAINPVKMPPTGSTGTLSGNPLTMVDSATVGGVGGWKFIGDSTKMMEVGYYPGDVTSGGGATMARALTMGMVPPVFNPAITINGGGLLNGSYQWMCAFRRSQTQARSNPSAASRYTQAIPAVALVAQSVTFTVPTTPIDPITGAADAHILVDVYRFGGTVFAWKYVGTTTSGASFTDNLPDAQILSALEPSQTVDPVTGISRFNLFQPFPTQDIARFNTTNPGTVTQVADGSGTNTIWILTAGAGDTFNTGILQGSAISINNKLWTVYQVRSSTVIEIAEDATGNMISGNTYPWAIPAGTLIMGTPCPHIWGPYGTGSAGSTIFGCGAANAVDTLFWTNGNDPDSTDIANSIVVTSPSEPLRGGCVFNGTPFVWSTERMFQIFPNLTAPGQFYVQEVVGGKGLWMEWSLTVQSNSIADQSITWRGKDGIYNFTPGGGTQSLTDSTLYPLFPHDNQPGSGIGTVIGASNSAGTVFPMLNGRPGLTDIPPPDDTQPKYHRLTWFDGILFYDYVGLVIGFNRYRTAVLDSKQSGGWVAFDVYLTTGGTPVARSAEIAANNLKVAVGGTIYDYTGLTDDGSTITSWVTTRQDDCGDPRGMKLFGDAMADVDPGGSTGGNALTITAWTDYSTTNNSTKAFSGAGRVRQPIDLSSNGLGVLSATLGMDYTWGAQSATAPVILYQYVFDWVSKPEITGLRALDKTDDGYSGAKYLRGFSIECNTFLSATNQTRKVNVLVDGTAATNPLTGTSVFSITTGTNTQIELPFAVTPTVGTELQLAIDATDAATVGWQVFSVRWVWEKWPDLARTTSAIMNLGSNRPKFIRGLSIPTDTNAAAVTLQFVTDSGTVTPSAITSAAGKKTVTGIAFTPPILSHEIQIIPNGVARLWYDEIAWDFEEWPELTLERSPWITLGSAKPRYIRGFTMPVDTGGNPATYTIQYDGALTTTTSAVTSTANQKTSAFFGIVPPILAHQVQIQPTAISRTWWNEIVWDAEEWPELVAERYPFQDLGTAQAKYLRSLELPMETNGSATTMRLYFDGALLTFPSVTSSPLIKTVFPLVPTVPLVGHEFQLESPTPARVWYGEAKWDFEVWPELSQVVSPWLNAGDPGAKFMQGFVMPVDTAGASVFFTVTYDGGSAVVGPISTPANRKTPVPFSFFTPFIAHEFQITPSGNCRCWYEEIKWIWEPCPELTFTWETQETDHDMPGFHYFGPQAFIAYIGSFDAPTLTVTTQYGSSVYVLPISNGAYTRSQIPMQPQKAKWRKYRLTSTGGMRLFLRDTSIPVKAWGDTGPFRPMQPFGEISRAAGARI